LGSRHAFLASSAPPLAAETGLGGKGITPLVLSW